MPAYTPTYTRQNVLVGQAKMYVAPYSLVTPPELPADTVALGAAWGAPWTPPGATEEGMTFNFSRSSEAVRIEEQATPTHLNTTEIDWNISTTLSEDTLLTWKLSMGGGVITQIPAAVGQPAVETLTISSDLEQLVFGFEGVNEFGFWRRVLIPLVTSNGTVEASYRRAVNARRYATVFGALCAPEEVEIRNMKAVALP